MAAQDYGSGVAPFKRAIKSVQLSDGAGTPNTLSCPDFDGQLMTTINQRESSSYKPNGRRPSGGPIVTEQNDTEESFTLRIGLKSWVGSTAHTPIEFMQGKTVNSVALTSTGAAGKFLFTLTVTYDGSAEDGGGASQTVTRQYVELLDPVEVEVDGHLYVDCACINHENGPTLA